MLNVFILITTLYSPVIFAYLIEKFFMKTAILLFKFLCTAFLFFCLTSCRKSAVHPDYPAGSDENVNSWILDSMKVYYYWNTALPYKPDVSQDPSSFFRGIKNGSDRFSALVNPDLPGTYPPSLVHTLGFDLIALQTTDGPVQTVISLVVPGSRAAGKGLLRGDVIKTINGVVPSASNIWGLTENCISAGTADLEITGKSGVITITKLTNAEDPVYTYKVFRSGGKTTGYLFLNSFETTALAQLIPAFVYFKQQQVQELIVDLRYNPGGSVPVAAALATMLAPGAAEGNVFVQYRGNSNAGNRQSTFAAELSQLPSGTRKSFSQLSGYRLGLNRVYILTGSHTASAAELLINSLRPYMTVIQLGRQTLGKDMASFVIRDYRSPQIVQKWEIYPMIFKLYNASGSGDYSGGLVPDQTVDELSVLPLVPFGELDDPLIQRCLASGGGVASAKRVESVTEHPAVLFDSRDKVDANTAGITVARH